MGVVPHDGRFLCLRSRQGCKSCQRGPLAFVFLFLFRRFRLRQMEVAATVTAVIVMTRTAHDTRNELHTFSVRHWHLCLPSLVGRTWALQ